MLQSVHKKRNQLGRRQTCRRHGLRKEPRYGWADDRAGAPRGVIAFAALTAGQAHAAWPDRTITLIVIFPPGGSNDLLGRLIAAELAPALGQNVIVENRAGANGNIGLAAGARAAPDGTTLWSPRGWY